MLLHINAAVGKLVKPPDLQSGHCGFESHRQYKIVGSTTTNNQALGSK